MLARVLVFSGIVGCCALFSGCTEEGTTEPSIFYYEHAKPIIESKCNSCHFDGGVTPFALDTYEQVFKMKEAISVAVSMGTMPPWGADPACGEYQKNGSLTELEKQTLLNWVEQGGQQGDPSKEGSPVHNPAHDAELTRIDLSLSMSQPYTPKKFPDDYRCFVMDWEAGANDGYVTGFRALPDNLSVAHHVIAYLIPPGEVAQIQALDEADPDYGYECFGGPGTTGRFEWLGAWAPGGRGDDFPQGTGIKLTEGSKIVIQMHYNTYDSEPEADQTSIELKIDEEVDKRATILLWLNFMWTRGDQMLIPAGEQSVSHSYVQDPTLFLRQFTGGAFESGRPFTIHWSALHMHQLGKKIRLWIERASSENACLVDVPNYDFNWQFVYQPTEPVVFNPGDRLGISCEWDNSAANQHRVDGQLRQPQDVRWGDGTQDEMCLGVIYITQD